MNQCIRAVLGASLLSAFASAFGHEFRKGDLLIDHPWTRATARGQSVAAGYLEVRNGGRAADRIVGASTPAAERIELHVVMMEGGVMKMRQVPSYDVPARGKVQLKPRGPHLMIIGIRREFRKDERIPVTLRFETAGEVAIELAVEGIDAGSEHGH